MAWPARKAVLVPVDFSDASFTALREALTMVDAPSCVTVVHVVADPGSQADYIRAALTAHGVTEGRAEAALRERLAALGCGDVNVVVRTGDAGEVVADVAKQLGCDLIVMPSHGRRGLSRLFLGSVAERVLRSARCPVLILRATPDGGA